VASLLNAISTVGHFTKLSSLISNIMDSDVSVALLLAAGHKPSSTRDGHQLLVYADNVNLLGDNIDTIKKNMESLI
jgi:hypothetical protein